MSSVDGTRPDGQQLARQADDRPPVRLVRLLPEVAGGARREVHMVPVTDLDAPAPEVMRAYCQALLRADEVEQLADVGGQPCNACSAIHLMMGPRPGGPPPRSSVAEFNAKLEAFLDDGPASG